MKLNRGQWRVKVGVHDSGLKVGRGGGLWRPLRAGLTSGTLHSL